MSKLQVHQTSIENLLVIQPAVHGDDRGYFFEAYNIEDFKEIGINEVFVQDNESKSKKGVLRGLHFQTKNPQGKLVRVIQGEVYDAAVDLRKGSATYGKWFGVYLSGENKTMFYIPPGFAHGFLVVSEEAVFTYKCTSLYDSESDSGIKYDDKDIGIAWPFHRIETLLLSEKDKNQKTLNEMRIEF